MSVPSAPANLDGSFVATRLPALIGLGFGVLFLLINAGSLPIPWPTLVRAGGVVAAVAVGTWVIRRPVLPAPRPAGRAMRTYWTSLAVEAVAIPAGVFALERAGRPEYGVLWVIAVVGLHFLPFAGAFRRPEYAWLGLTLVTIAVAGAALARILDSAWTGASGVLAGTALIGFAAVFGIKAAG